MWKARTSVTVGASLVVLLSGSTAAQEMARSSEEGLTSGAGPGDTASQVGGPLIIEGFEDGFTPPIGWFNHRTNPNETWTTINWSPQSGNWNATMFIDTQPEEEVLYSPLVFGTTDFSVRFWAEGSTFWCRDENDNCDFNVYLDPDRIWNNGNEILVHNVEQDWSDSFQWTQSTIDLAAYADGTRYHIAFAYISNGGAQVSLDDIEIFAESAGLLFADGFESGNAAYWAENPIVGTHYSYTGPPVVIPDANPAGISSMISVPSTQPISDILVNVEISHEAQGDLVVKLTSPQGTEVTLHNRTGGPANHIWTSYDSPTFPDGPGAMSDFDGESPTGDWTLSISDMAGLDHGFLVTWSLDISPEPDPHTRK